MPPCCLPFEPCDPIVSDILRFLSHPILQISQIFTAVQDDDIVAGLAALAATPPSEAVRVLPSEGSSAVHVAARSGNAVWLQLLLWVRRVGEQIKREGSQTPNRLLPVYDRQILPLTTTFAARPALQELAGYPRRTPD